mgnify:CR=1 FL=1
MFFLLSKNICFMNLYKSLFGIDVKSSKDIAIINQKLNNIINAFCVSEFEAGRHVTRLQILHGSFVPATKPLAFSKQPNKKVVIGSDHAGFALKEAIKEHLQEKGYQIIDVGTNSLDSTHYSLFGLAMAKHIPEVSFAIGCCFTGMGIANALNKFKIYDSF